MNRFLQVICIAVFTFLAHTSIAQDGVVVHTVEEGQTLYSISKLYQVTPQEIKSYNPLIDDSFTIKPGQVLRIKLKGGNELKPVLDSMTKRPIVHKVQPKETLYGISKGYQIEIEKIKEWNQLPQSQISIGQELIVGWRYVNKQGQKPLPTEVRKLETVVSGTPAQPMIIEKPQQVNQYTPPVETYPSSTVSAPIPVTNKQHLLQQRFDAETAEKPLTTKAGPTIWFNTENQMMSARYYALFSDAPIGSVIKVKNLINQRVVFVKVIGGLPNTAENHGAMMKMTPAAKGTLGMRDAKIRVEVTYVAAPN